MVVNPAPHNVPDVVNPQAAANNQNIIRDFYLELEHNNIPDNQLIQGPGAEVQQENRNVCMT